MWLADPRGIHVVDLAQFVRCLPAEVNSTSRVTPRTLAEVKGSQCVFDRLLMRVKPWVKLRISLANVASRTAFGIDVGTPGLKDHLYSAKQNSCVPRLVTVSPDHRAEGEANAEKGN